MAWSIDARIPLTMLPDGAALQGVLAGRPAALLAEGPPPAQAGVLVSESFVPSPAHAAACACCAGRSAAALALDRLFQARVRGRSGWFDRVLALPATAEGRAEIIRALTEDRLTAARFRAAT